MLIVRLNCLEETREDLDERSTETRIRLMCNWRRIDVFFRIVEVLVSREI